MGFPELLKKIVKNIGAKKEPDQPITTVSDDYESRDKYLKSLRRQYRTIMDEREKEILQARIKNYFKKKNSEILTGTGILGKTKYKKRFGQKKQGFLGKGNMIKKAKLK